jgi:hypothetical protein
MPAHHDMRSSDVFTRRLHGTLAAAAELGPSNFSELLPTPGVGARTVRSLAMVAEIVYGSPYRFQDPARFSLAHGGKDRHPYPVPLKVYDETIRVLKSGMQKAKLGPGETLDALKRLDHQARLLERTARGPSFEAFVAQERARSPSLHGRSVFGWEKDLAPGRQAKKASPLTPPGRVTLPSTAPPGSRHAARLHKRGCPRPAFHRRKRLVPFAADRWLGQQHSRLDGYRI